ncbi:hypothetical protein X735_32960 [Mesorhizobium sp. L2C085B000]|nr:hypothetical protein X735_32960 [Mesorhizobium sp. L2C085B000]
MRYQADAAQLAQLNGFRGRRLGGLGAKSATLPQARDRARVPPLVLVIEMIAEVEIEHGRAQRLKPLTPVSSGRFEVADSLGHQ